MSRQTWAEIVYGRSYHLDFRFITIPQDFTAREIAWASPYILATTQQARNLSTYPRWSLFKNDSHCVLGVTCMVRDLISTDENLIDVMAKDDRGRPLYVFVGYVTQLNQSQSLTDLPAYTGEDLSDFKPLYQKIEKVWLVRDYHNRKPLLSEYKPLSISVDTASETPKLDRISQLNNQAKYPDKTFVWQRSTQQNKQLWLASARCSVATSICLDVRGKYLVNSPFLNQTITKIEEFTVCDRSLNKDSDRSNLPNFQLKMEAQKRSSFGQKISTKAKQDIELTWQQAAKVTLASQEIINNLTNKADSEESDRQSSSAKDTENFGFKTKKSSSSSKEQDWF